MTARPRSPGLRWRGPGVRLRRDPSRIARHEVPAGTSHSSPRQPASREPWRSPWPHGGLAAPGLEYEAAEFDGPDMNERHLRISEDPGEHRLGGRGITGLAQTEQPAGQDPAVRRVGTEHAVRAGQRLRVARASRAGARPGVDEDRAGLLIGTRIGARFAGPAAQRGVRDQGDPFAWRNWAQAAAERTAALLIHQQPRCGSGIIALPQFVEHVRGDGPYL